MSNPTALPDAWIRRLFDLMSTSYGSRFTDMWKGINPDDVRRRWAEKLAGFTGEQLTAAINALDEKEWPPSLPEFVTLCRGAARRDGPVKALPAPEITRAEAEKRLRELDAFDAMQRQQSSGYDLRSWAKSIVAAWQEGTYDPRWSYGYGLACKALGIVQKAHPKPHYRAPAPTQQRAPAKPDYRARAAGDDDTGLTSFP